MNVAIINCFDTYEQRIKLLYSFFEKHKNNVKVYTSNYEHIEKTVRENPPENYIYVPAIKYRRNISMRRAVSHIKYAKDTFRLLQKEQSFDLLWVLLPPNSLAEKATQYKKEHPNTKLVFDIIDMWPETMPIAGIKNSKIIKKWGALRDNNLTNADYIITECNLFKKIIENTIENKEIKTVYFSKKANRIKTNARPPKDKIALCYLGSINNIIDIAAIAQIIKRLGQKKPIELHIIGDGERKADLVKEATSAGAEIIDHGKVYDQKEKAAILGSCHYGLNIMKDTVCVGLTMKSLDYFSAGLPIINNIKGDTWDLVEKYKAGVNFTGGKIEKYTESMRDNCQKLFKTELSDTQFEKNLEQVVRRIS